MENLELNDYLRGKELYSVGEYEKALIYFEKSIKTDPNNPEYLYALGSTNLYLDDVENALNNYEKCLKVDPSHLKSFIGKISCLEFLDKPEEALKLIEIYQQKNNNDLVAARKAITLIYLNFDKEDVFNCFKDIKIEKEPYIYYLKAALSDIYLDWDNKLKNLNKALEYSDKYKTRLDDEVYVNKREIYLDKIDYLFDIEEFDKALEICEILLKNYPKDLDALYKKARIYYYIDFETSLNVLNFALYHNPNDINLLNLKASIYNYQGSTKTALKIYEKINKINKDYEYSWGNMALIYYFDKKYEKAFQHAKKAYEINPNFGFAIYYASRALKKLGNRQLYLDWERKLNDPDVDMIYLEKNLQERLVKEPWRFESIGLKLKFKEREYTLKDRSGRLDILYEDETTMDYIVVELKIIKANSEAYYQISNYVDSIKKTIGRNRKVSGILVSLGQDENCKKLIDGDPKIIQVDYKKLGLE